VNALVGFTGNVFMMTKLDFYIQVDCINGVEFSQADGITDLGLPLGSNAF
jgi:energy-converting hydrogenase Eha subunit G